MLVRSLGVALYHKYPRIHTTNNKIIYGNKIIGVVIDRLPTERCAEIFQKAAENYAVYLRQCEKTAAELAEERFL